MRSWDVFPALNLPLAGWPHLTLVDLLDACQGPIDEEVLRQRLNGATQLDIAQEMGVHQTSISRRLFRLMERAGFEHLGLRLRGRPQHAAPTVVVPSGLRFGERNRLDRSRRTRKVKRLTYGADADDSGMKVFRAAAAAEGMTLAEWCRREGIVDGAALQRIESGEVSAEALYQDGIKAKFVGADDVFRAYRRLRQTVIVGRLDSP